MMANDLDYQQLEYRRRELLRQAKIERLIGEARRDAPKMQHRLMVLLADVMISGGTHLRERAARLRLERQQPIEWTDSRLEVIRTAYPNTKVSGGTQS